MGTRGQLLALTAIAVALTGCARKEAEPAAGAGADTVYVNGSILTMAGSTPTYVEALAVKDGRISFAGSRGDAEKMAGSARVVDLGGKALLPGFLDAHSHYINSLLVANQSKLYAPPSGPAKDVQIGRAHV